MTKRLSSDEAMTAILSYLGFLVLIPLFIIKKRNRFIEFHLKQGLALFAVEIVIWIAGACLVWVFVWTPALILSIVSILNLVWLLVFVVSIIAIVKAYSGEMWEIPGIKGLAERVGLPKV